jgi:hypothetical protein
MADEPITIRVHVEVEERHGYTTRSLSEVDHKISVAEALADSEVVLHITNSLSDLMEQVSDRVVLEMEAQHRLAKVKAEAHPEVEG